MMRLIVKEVAILTDTHNHDEEAWLLSPSCDFFDISSTNSSCDFFDISSTNSSCDFFDISSTKLLMFFLVRLCVLRTRRAVCH